MVLDYIVSLEYRVNLNSKLNYFDVVPDMEKALRLRCNLSDSGDYFTVVDWRAGQERFNRSKRTDSSVWHPTGKLDEKSLKDLGLDGVSLELTSDENRMLGYLYDKFRHQIIDEGWYLVRFTI